MIAWSLLACGPTLRPPELTYGPPAALPLVQPESDRKRWYVPGRVGDREGLWFVDTGYTNTTCDDDLPLALGLEVVPRGSTVGESGEVPVGRTRLPAFSLAGHEIEGLTCLVRDLPTTSSVRDPEVLGVLGMDVLSRLVLRFDPGVAELGLDPPGEPPDDGVKLKVSGGRSPRARLRASLLGSEAWMLVDTGTAHTWVDGARRGWSPTRDLGDRGVVGTGGSTTARRLEYDIDEVLLGGVPGPPITALDRDVGLGRADLLGLDVLAAYRLTLDGPHRRATLSAP
ncbi:MAG: retropepsin-like domain-containing protein [Alphaproteobacteria bacterium]|nr:retropepsin-like domain-containing protein [Alphaproteobacteria bacterium]